MNTRHVKPNDLLAELPLGRFWNIAAKWVQNSDFARFTTPESNLSCNKSGCFRLKKVVAERREWFYFLPQHLYILRVLPERHKANLICSKWLNSRAWRDSRVILSNQESVFRKLAFIGCKTGLTVGGKTCNIAMFRNKLHVFVARFTVALAKRGR